MIIIYLTKSISNPSWRWARGIASDVHLSVTPTKIYVSLPPVSERSTEWSCNAWRPTLHELFLSLSLTAAHGQCVTRTHQARRAVGDRRPVRSVGRPTRFHWRWGLSRAGWPVFLTPCSAVRSGLRSWEMMAASWTSSSGAGGFGFCSLLVQRYGDRDAARHSTWPISLHLFTYEPWALFSRRCDCECECECERVFCWNSANAWTYALVFATSVEHMTPDKGDVCRDTIQTFSIKNSYIYIYI